MHKRFWSFLLAVVMVFSMLPNTALFAQAAETQPIHRAAYATTVAVDGNVTETAWLLHGKLSGVETAPQGAFGALWKADTLYLAVAPGDATEVAFTLNGKTLTAALGDSVTLSGDLAANATAAKADALELSIPFSALDFALLDYGLTMPLAVTLTNATASASYDGTLGFIGVTRMASNVQTSYFSSAHGVLVNSNNGYEDADGGIRMYDLYKETGNSNGRLYFSRTNIYKDTTVTRWTEFDFHADSMPAEAIPTAIDNGFSNFGFLLYMSGSGTAVPVGIVNTAEGLYFQAGTKLSTFHTIPIGKEVGDTFHVALGWTADDVLLVYIDGQLLASFDDVLVTLSGNYINYGLYFSLWRRYSVATSSADDYDITLTNIAAGTGGSASVLDALTAEDILGTNTAADSVTANLALPESISNGQLTAPLTWTSSNTDVITNEGKVTRGITDQAVTMTATITGTTITKTIPVTVSKLVLDAKIRTAAITLDGNLAERSWYNTTSFPGSTGTVSALWDKDNLYFGAAHSGASSLTLTLGEKEYAITATSVPDGIEASFGTSAIEVKIPFEALGIRPSDYNVALTSFQAKLDDTFLSPGGALELILRGEAVNEFSPQIGGGVSISNNTAIFDISGSSDDTALRYYQRANFPAIDHTKDLLLTQTLTFNSLPVIDGTMSNSTAPTDRFFFWICSPSNGLYPSILASIYNADANGNLLLRVSGLNESSSPVAIPLGRKIGTTFRLDTLWKTDNSLWFYVDGQLLAVFENAHMNVAFSGQPIFSMRYIPTGIGAANFTVSKVALVTYEYSRIEDEITPAAIFGDTDLDNVTAALNMPSTFESPYLGTVPLTWTSSDEGVVSVTGTVTQPAGKSGTAIELKLSVGDNELWRQDVFVPAVDQSSFASPTTVNTSFNPDTISLDGTLANDEWSLSSKLQDSAGTTVGTLGAQWQADALYLAANVGTATALSLELNGKAVAVDLSAKTLTVDSVSVDGAAVAVSGTVAEIRIPFAALGITVNNYGIEIPVAVTAGSGSFTGTLKLTSIDWAATHSSNTFKADAVSGVISDGFIVSEAISDGYHLYDLYNYEGGNLAGKRNYAIYMNNTFRPTLYDRTTTTYVEFDFLAKALPVTTASAATGWDSTIPNYGFVWVMTDQYPSDSEFANVVSCGIFNTLDGLMLAVMDVNGTNLFPLNKDVGDVLRIGTAWYPNGTAAVYINGELIATVENAQRWLTNMGSGIISFNTYRDRTNAATCREDNIDVYVTNLAAGKFYGSNLLDSLSFERIKGENTDQYAVTTDLVLSSKISNSQITAEQNITWESSDPSVVSTDGKVTQPSGNGKLVTLTAALADGSAAAIDVFVKGLNPSTSVMVAENDLDTPKGAGTAIDTHEFTLDENNNSIIFAQEAAQTINVVKLTDGDSFSRLNEDVLTLWVSDDNVTYTQIENFKLLCTGENWYLYDFTATAKYIKVHCTHYDGKEADFIGDPLNMISAYYEDVFGASGDFTSEVSLTVANGTGADRLDDAYEVSDPGITLDGSVRVYLGSELLYHYIDGDKLIVRIPEIKAGQSVTLKILSGNDAAIDISNKEYVYEVTYGAREMMVNEGGYFMHVLDNGTMIGFCNDGDGQLYRSFSYNGGRTWTTPEKVDCATGWLNGHGGFIEDTHTDRLVYYGNYYTSFVADDLAASDNKTRFIYSDDGGVTWNRLCELETDANYILSYSDGVELSCWDGEGPNVDFVLPLGSQHNNSGGFCTRVAYSTDGGLTWQTSDTKIIFHADGEVSGAETGLSEGSILERDDGVLVLIVRCQSPDSQNFARAYSYDHGITWTVPAELTDIYTVNTQPMLYRYDDSDLLLWSGNNILGGNSYHRTPMNIAVSYDGMETFVNIQDLYVKYSTQGLTKATRTQCQNPALRKWGDDTLVINWTHYGSGNIMTTRVENFTDYFYRTKGAYDSFEHGTVKYEGWSVIKGFTDISDVEKTEGTYSMKLDGESAAARSIPYLQDGTISMQLYVADADTANLSVSLQSAHSAAYGEGAPLGFRIENGILTPLGAESPSELKLNDGWNTITYRLALSGGTAALCVNGGDAISVPVDTNIGNYVTFVHLTNDDRTAVYVDEFMACDTASEQVPDTSEPELAMHSLSLEGDIAINYYMQMDASIAQDDSAYMQFTMADGQVLRIPASQSLKKVINGSTYYAFSCHVAAKEMTDQVKAQFFWGKGQSTKESIYSVKAYADYVLTDDTGAYDEVKPLITAMLNYGAAAQLQFGYKTDDLANAGYETQWTASITNGEISSAGAGIENTVTFAGSNLVLETKVSMRLYFAVAEGAEVTFTHNGETLTYVPSGGSDAYTGYVEISDIAAKAVDESFTVTVSDAASSADITYSPMAYCYQVQQGDYTQTLKDLAVTVYLYNQAANTYFE